MGERRCPACLMVDFDGLYTCPDCGVDGCDLCMFEHGDIMYGAPTCCAVALADYDRRWQTRRAFPT